MDDFIYHSELCREDGSTYPVTVRYEFEMGRQPDIFYVFNSETHEDITHLLHEEDFKELVYEINREHRNEV